MYIKDDSFIVKLDTLRAAWLMPEEGAWVLMLDWGSGPEPVFISREKEVIEKKLHEIQEMLTKIQPNQVPQTSQSYFASSQVKKKYENHKLRPDTEVLEAIRTMITKVGKDYVKVRNELVRLGYDGRQIRRLWKQIEGGDK